MLVSPQHLQGHPLPSWSSLVSSGVYYMPHLLGEYRTLPSDKDARDRSCLLGWKGMLVFLSRGRGGCVSDLVKPLLLKAHSLTGKALESKEQ